MRIRGLISGTAVAALFAYVTGPTLAQEIGGFRASLGVDQRFSYGDNLALGVPGSATDPEEGRTSLSTTNLSLLVQSFTPTDEFTFEIGGALSYGSMPTGSTLDTGFIDPYAKLRYSRQGYNARFLFDASYRESAVTDSVPLWELGDTGEIVDVPEDLSLLRGTGTRASYSSRVELETGINSPIGLRLSATLSGARYSNAASAALNDYDRTGLAATTYFRFDQATTGVIDLSVSRYKRSGRPDTQTRIAQVGVDRELSNQAMVSARIGYSESEDANNVATSNQSNGITGSLAYSAPLPDGSFNASYALSRTTGGEINKVLVGRSFDLPSGSLSFEIGATSLYGTTPKAVGSVNYLRNTQYGQYTLRLNRDVITDSTDQDRFSTTLAAMYRQELSQYSSIVANVSYFMIDGSATSNQVERTDLLLSYQYALTEDWSLNSGINLRMRDEDTVGTAKSNELFVSLSRRFDLF